jgi:hypothetical protein
MEWSGEIDMDGLTTNDNMTIDKCCQEESLEHDVIVA